MWENEWVSLFKCKCVNRNISVWLKKCLCMHEWTTNISMDITTFVCECKNLSLFTCLIFGGGGGEGMLGFPGGLLLKSLPAMCKTWVWSLGQEDPLEKEMATHSSTPAWKIQWTEEPEGLQFMGSQRIRLNWATFTREGNGTPLQYSCLENPRDRGTYWAAIYGVAQSRTWLKRLSSSSSRATFTHMLCRLQDLSSPTR